MMIYIYIYIYIACAEENHTQIEESSIDHSRAMYNSFYLQLSRNHPYFKFRERLLSQLIRGKIISIIQKEHPGSKLGKDVRIGYEITIDKMA